MSDEPRGTRHDDVARDGAPASKGRSVGRRIVAWLILLVVLVVLALVAASMLPRWWGQFTGNLSDGGLWRSVWWGLAFGFLFTYLPVLVLVALFRRWRHWKAPVFLLVLAVVLALPNLMTLWIVFGTNEAAHDAERTWSTTAPYFAAMTGWGALAGVVIGITTELLWRSWRRRGRRLKALRRADAGVGEHGEALRPLPEE